MDITIRRLTHDEARQHLDGLASTLAAAVNGGAGVGFILPFSEQDARNWWENQLPDVASGARILFGAISGARLVGTVSLIPATPQNQPHRADIGKMLVHPDARRLGVGEALLRAAEVAAKEIGRTLLVLDTVTGSAAERLYTRIGWQRVGPIPNYALNPSGRFDSTTVMWKAL